MVDPPMPPEGDILRDMWTAQHIPLSAKSALVFLGGWNLVHLVSGRFYTTYPHIRDKAVKIVQSTS